MKINKTNLVVLLALICTHRAAISADGLTPADRESVTRVALEIRDAVLRGDTKEILKHVGPKTGLTCTDENIPYTQIAKDLNDDRSYLYLSLFDTKRYSKECGAAYPPEFPAISDKEFFSENDQSMEINSYPNGYVEIVFKSHIKNHAQREWGFKKEEGQWKLVDGLIVGDCSCG